MKISLLPHEREQLRGQLAHVHYTGTRLHGGTWLAANEAARAALRELGLQQHFDDLLVKTLIPVVILRVLGEVKGPGPGDLPGPLRPVRESRIVSR